MMMSRFIRKRSKKVSFITVLVFLVGILLVPTQSLAAESITINVATVLNDIPNNPIGLVTNHLYDSDIYNPGRTKTLDQAFLDMGIGTARFTEGEFSDSYLWTQPPYPISMATLKPKLSYWENRMPFTDANHIWQSTGIFHDTQDFNEFMSVVKKTGVEPFVEIGIDSILDPNAWLSQTQAQLKASAVAWVQYAKNVYPGLVKYWELGNEPFYPGNAQKTWDPNQYAAVFNDFAAGMKAVDPNIKIGVPFYWDNTSWNSKVLPVISANVDFLIPHVYGSSESIIATAQNAINTYINAEDRSRIKINLTETSVYDTVTPQKNNMGRAIEMVSKIGRELNYNGVQYLHFWVSRNGQTGPTYDERCALDVNGNLLPVGKAFKVWGNFIREKMVSATGTANVPAFASYSPGTKELSVFLVNASASTMPVNLALQNYTGSYANEKWVFKGTDPNDTNPTLAISTPVTSWNGGTGNFSVDPYSVTILTFKSGLLTNGNFENGLTNWASNGGSIGLDTSNIHLGKKAVKAFSRSNTYHGPKQNIKDILSQYGPGVYDLGAWIKMSTGSDNARITVATKATGASSYTYSLINPVAVSSSGWTYVSGSKDIQWQGTLQDAYLYIETTGTTNDFYVDDMMAVQKNLLQNGSAESGLPNWSANGGTIALETANIHAGVNSIKSYTRTQTYNGPQQDIINLLTQNGTGTYTIGAWVKLSSGTDTARISVKTTVNGTSSYFLITPVSVNSSGWTYVSGTVNIAWSGSLQAAKLYVETSGTMADLYVDDMQMYK